MKKEKIFSIVLIMGIMVLIILSVPAYPQQKKKEKEAIFIPKEIKAELKKGIEDRTPRRDIPFEIIENVYLPARQNIHNIIFFKTQNKDLDFTSFSDVSTEEGEEKEVSPESDILMTDLNVFLWFQQMDGGRDKEVYVPFQLEEERENYDPDEESMYSVGYPLSPGKYMLAMAITTKDLKKIGTQYYEFELPSPESFVDNLGITPVFFIREIKRMESAETTTKIHEGFFTYSVLKIYPILKNVFVQGDTMQMFFYIFGAQPDPENNKFDLTAHYTLNRGEEEIVRYAEGTYDAPLVSQPLYLKRTVLVKTKKGDEIVDEKKESRDIEPGQYKLVIELKDNITGKSMERKINITVKASEK